METWASTSAGTASWGVLDECRSSPLLKLVLSLPPVTSCRMPSQESSLVVNAHLMGSYKWRLVPHMWREADVCNCCSETTLGRVTQPSWTQTAFVRLPGNRQQQILVSLGGRGGKNRLLNILIIFHNKSPYPSALMFWAVSVNPSLMTPSVMTRGSGV